MSSVTAPAGEGSKIRYPLSCYVVGILLIFFLLMSASIIVIVHLNVFTILESAKILRAHVMCGGFGMMGAALAAIRKYYRVLITERTALETHQVATPTDWTLGWVYYYLTRPLLGAILGALTFTLSYIGVQVLTKPGSPSISDEGQFVLYALAFIAGFSVTHVLDRLEAVAKQTFGPRLQTLDNKR